MYCLIDVGQKVNFINFVENLEKMAVRSVDLFSAFERPHFVYIL